jgi:hypothetical protein
MVLLLNSGVDCCARDDEGFTPTHRALMRWPEYSEEPPIRQWVNALTRCGIDIIAVLEDSLNLSSEWTKGASSSVNHRDPTQPREDVKGRHRTGRVYEDV